MKTNKILSCALLASLCLTVGSASAELYDGVANAYVNRLDVTLQCTSDANSVKALDDAKLKMLSEEVKWIDIKAISLAIKDMATMPGYDASTAAAQYSELEALYKEGFFDLKDNTPAAVAKAQRALALKKAILFSNPLLTDGKILAAKYNHGEKSRSIGAGNLGTCVSNWTSQIDAPREGFDAAIIEISDLMGEVKMKELHKPYGGTSIADLRLHWDGDRALFTQAMSDKRWNVFEIDLNTNKVSRVVDNEEPDLDFFDATYLPSGKLIVNSSIGYNGVPCVNGTDGVSNTMVYDPDTKNLRQITFDQDANWNPIVMNNGRVMYTRWEYTDLTHYYSRIVMHMNPDGTENKALYGSGKMFPNSTFDIQPLPNQSSAFLGIISGHHGVARAGRLIIFDPLKSRAGVEGMVQEIPYRERKIKEVIKDRLVDNVWPQFVKPTVINENYFLVAGKMSKTSLWGLYLVDRFDNVTCIMQSEEQGYISPILIRKTETPPAIPERVDLTKKEATFFIQDLYEGEGLRGIPRGTVKELRIYSYEYAYIQTPSDHQWQGIQAGWDIKRTLGTVPVEEDGSVIFTAPANTPISIQPIDEKGVAVQWMRSWVVGQPGEIVSCIGCHEDQNQIPIPKRVIASTKSATPLTKPEDGVRSLTFELDVQPILDRACVACHVGKGKAFDLRTGSVDQFGFGPSYLKLHPFVRRQGGEGDMAVLTPYEYNANTSELVRMLKKGHYNVELTDKEWRKLYQWIDYNAPYKGNFDNRKTNMMPYVLNPRETQYERRIELKNKYALGMGVDWQKEIDDYAAVLKAKGKIEAVKPAPMPEVKAKTIKAKGWPFTPTEALAKQGGERETKIVEVAKGVKIKFVKIPAGQFVMGSYKGEPDNFPTSKVTIGKSFWMSELEITNEQVRALMPDHNSMFVTMLWKDHINAGYPANDPEQPAIRISQLEALEYGKKLSEKTGMNITLPTEAQWEWACRGGSDSDFWYGDLSADFGKKENLADKTTLQFAVAGVDPKPMKENNPRYKHYIFLPKEVKVDDGQLIAQGGTMNYEANPFGLYNMHGNLAEWTRSDYLPYPYTETSKEKAEYVVARGGSYFERPVYSTSYTRKYYYPYQRVFNVGFRLIIEE
ncbi:MAG: SUMF1/EgtB/PvdO family nonheme iron enzyme [Rikenellaceae bacterium]